MDEAGLRSLGVGRRQPDDPLFAAGDSLCRLYVREGIVDIDDEDLCHQVVASFPCEVPRCGEFFSSLLQFEMHYNSHHRFICSLCKKQLPSGHFLDLHLSETHDSFFAAQAERKPMYRCFVEDCSVMSQDEHQRRSHCIETHNFPHDFRYDQSLKKNKKSNFHSQPKTKNISEDMAVDGAENKKPQVSKHFTFGQARRGRSFSTNKKPSLSKEAKCSETPKLSESSVEMMDTLPV